MQLSAGLAVLATALGAWAASGITTDGTLAANQTFDYIVVGCGLTGLTLATRLAENANMTILCVEAGANSWSDPRVYDIYRYKDAFNTELDWSWSTEKGGMRGGKALGGGTSINGATWTRGASAQYDSWQGLLETSESGLGWNWAGMFTAMKKAEKINAPTDTQKGRGANGNTANYGASGAVSVKYPNEMYSGPQQKAFQSTVVNLFNLSTADVNGGNPNAVAFVPNSLNGADNDHRVSSQSAYLTPVIDRRKKYLVLTTHMVTKLLFSKTTVPVTVSGIQYKKSSNSGSTYTAYARREVILAAGAIQSPALLQLSGIGDSGHLSGLGIKSVVNLPTVGKNLQEQTMIQMGAKGTSSSNSGVKGRGPNDIIAFPNLAQLFGTKAANISSTISSSLATWASSQAGYALSSSALQTIYKAQADYIINKKAPVAELFYSTAHPADHGLLVWPLLPFSRGSVKISANNAFTKPTIHVGFYSVDIDMQMQVAASRMARQIFLGAPFSTYSAGETLPGSAVAGGKDATDTAWRNWIKRQFNGVSHPVASCAMMRRNLGGVVNGKLKVYDTTNLRVVDASVVPLQISGHLSSTLYGVAEKAAAFIRADNGT
ncbi:glucose oxidase [Auriculariales sp. MPI-PUGE-AT-0066]|nr:glucose oxidase [Auriculariales sp. MPI-PUGE-AT-0066]